MSDVVRATPREVATAALGPRMTKEIWSRNYEKVLPISLLDFDISAVLPAVFYMFRFGKRRGPGGFVGTFGPSEGTKSQRRNGTTAHSVASHLATLSADGFGGFDAEVEKAILADLLLCYCLENRGYELGRLRPVQRVAPTHYLAAWVDLPVKVVNLRHVPETIVVVLADQKKTAHVRQTTSSDKRSWFPVVGGPEDDIFDDDHGNVLLRAVGQGMRRGSSVGNLAGDRFDETVPVGIDQLLTIRIAQALEAAPAVQRGKSGSTIPNRRPIATRVSAAFSEDIRKFVREYAPVVPRQAFLEMTESCMAVGLTSILAGVVEVVLGWAETGAAADRAPAPRFVDSSAGRNWELRSVAEQSMDDHLRRLERFPVVLMCLRLLDYRARNNSAVKKRLKGGELPSSPVATEWIDFLGAVMHDRCGEAGRILSRLEIHLEDLAGAARDGGYPAVDDQLSDDDAQSNPVWRLAEALTSLQGRTVSEGVHKLVDSALHIDRPNGLATKRRTTRRINAPQGPRTRVVRSLIFTDPVLEYLVHRHLLPSGSGRKPRQLSFSKFIQILRDRYGLCVDQAPPGMTISNELLQSNRNWLERRLRDLGLLVGVNDAEAMKRLRSRFRQDKL